MITSDLETARALSVSFGVSSGDSALVVDLDDGRTITVPLAWFPRLYSASPEQRSEWRLVGDGIGIHWPEVDEDLSVRALLVPELFDRRRARETQEQPDVSPARDAWRPRPLSTGSIEDISSSSPAQAAKLREAGIRTVEALLERGATAQGRDEIAQATGVSRRSVLRWVNHADLFRVFGVAGEMAELLETAGVDTVAELARRDPQNLHQALSAINAQKKLVRQLPSEAEVADWIEQARNLPRVVSY